MCSKAGYLHLIVPADQFKLLCGNDVLKTYSFNTHTAKHLFCSVCGIKSFYVPRSHPDGISVNARCIDSKTIEDLTIDAAQRPRVGSAVPERSRRVHLVTTTAADRNGRHVNHEMRFPQWVPAEGLEQAQNTSESEALASFSACSTIRHVT